MVNIGRQIKRAFGSLDTFEPLPLQPTTANDGALSFGEFKGLKLWATRVYFSSAVARRWEALRSLSFPDRCCVCTAPPEMYLSVYSHIPVFKLMHVESVLNGVPHCATHGRDGRAKVVAYANPPSSSPRYVFVVTVSRTFLLELIGKNIVGEHAPPWRVFPGSDLYLWTQGEREDWMEKAFAPFWNSLTTHERQMYLDKWDAPSAWRAKFEYDEQYGRRG